MSKYLQESYDEALKEIEVLKVRLELAQKYMVTIGNIARRGESIQMQEINRHVDDYLDSSRSI